MKEFKIQYYYDRKNDEYYSDMIFVFDIETTSGWLKDGHVYKYEHEYSREFFLKETLPVAITYLWAFSYNDCVIQGRSIFDFLEVMNYLKKSCINVIIFVHNLGFEFQFLLNILTPKVVFARETYHPMKVVFEGYENIEFRCSYLLTRLSLENLGKEIGYDKAKKIDYTILRTPKTKLDNHIYEYNKKDVLVVYHAIKDKYLPRYGHVRNIPLTQTGEVRRVCKKLLKKNKEWCKSVKDMCPVDFFEYKFLTNCYYGASVHASYLYSGLTVKNVTSQDFTSSYPYVMCSEKFPISRFWKVDEYKQDGCLYLLKVKAKNVKVRGYMTYMSISKLEKCEGRNGKEYVVDNGKIFRAKEIVFSVTNIDFEDFMKCYDCEVELLEIYRAECDYLPRELILYILELYGKKTELKNVAGKEAEYQVGKEFINALYGMACTAILPDEVTFTIEDEWSKKKQSVEDINKKLKRLYNEDFKKAPFLPFQLGIFVTSYAKHNLWSCIYRDDNNKSVDEDVVYIDTDNIKYIHLHTFNWYNLECDKKLKKMCEIRNIDFNLTRPRDINGISHPLGHFEIEFKAKKFKTLGAKRYLYDDGELHLTCSGVAKKAVSDIKNFDDFCDGKYFDKRNEDVQNMQLQYIHNEEYLQDVIWNEGFYDECQEPNMFGIAMYKTGYKIGLKDDYLELLAQERTVTNGIL